MPPPHVDFWPFDLEVGVGVACDLGYTCAKFRLPRPFGFRVRADVCDIRQTDRLDGRMDGRRTTDADHRLMPPPLRGGGIISTPLTVGHLCHAKQRPQFKILLPRSSVPRLITHTHTHMPRFTDVSWEQPRSLRVLKSLTLHGQTNEHSTVLQVVWRNMTKKSPEYPKCTFWLQKLVFCTSLTVLILMS